METSEQIERFRDFFESYKDRIHGVIAKGWKSVVFEFSEVLAHDPELADLLLEDPENLLKAAELSLNNLDLPSDFIKIRFRNLPSTNVFRIRDLRSVHLDRFLAIEGLVRQTSDVRPQVTSAKFECPSCGNTMLLLQIDTQFREPSRCSCGRRGKFRLIHKDLIDAQRIVLEEAPETLEGGEQPKRLAVFLKGDLVDPKMEKRTTPGTKVKITGIVKEVAMPLRTGGHSTRYDIVMDSNYIEPIEETFEEMNITKEEEEEILEVSKDPKIYQRLVFSIAPSIYGHEDIKAALILQLMGGVQKVHEDGTKRRGDMHVLLIGDPGCIAGDSQVALIYKGMEKLQNLGSEHLQPIREAVTKIRKDSKDKYYDFATKFHYYKKQPVLKVITETGKEVICTYNQPFLTKEGWKRADEIKTGEKIRVMPKIPTMVKKFISTNFKDVKKTSGKLKEVKLPEKVTPELASLFGYIIGDGNLHPKGYRVTCFVNDEEKGLVEKLDSLWKKTFNVESRIAVREKEEEKTIDDGNGLLRKFISKQKVYVVEVNSRQVAYSLSFLSSKRVPQEIFRSPHNVVAPFISWLFEADGCAFGNGRGRTAIQLKSSTQRLLKDVQLLLLYFGIQSRIVGDNLCIRRAYDMARFIKHIGFVSEKKKNKLKEVLKIIENRSEMQKRKHSQRWEKISGIIQNGIMDVYDLEVPKSERFVANGIVCHNSGKSQMLQFVSKIAPKARLVSGKGASSAGLTAAVVKDEFMRGWALEAGAFVLANGGFCLSGDTKILLADNNVEDIKSVYERVIAGEKIFVKSMDENNFELKESLIKNASVRKANKLYKLVFDTGEELKITEEHPLLKWDNGISWVMVDNLNIGDYIMTRRTFPDSESTLKIRDIHENFQTQPDNIPGEITEEFMELVGLIATDGSISKKKNVIRFYTKSKEIEERYLYLTQKIFNKKPSAYTDKRNGVKQFFFSSKNLCDIICSLGIVRGSKSKMSFNRILSMPNHLIKSFLIGALNGDGSISNRKGGGIIDLVCSSKESADSYRDLFRKIGAISKVNSTIKTIKKKGLIRKGVYISYKVSVTGVSNIAILNDSRLVSWKFNSLQKIIKRKDTSIRLPLVKSIIDKIRKIIPHYEKHLLYKSSLRTSRLSSLKVSRNVLARMLINLSDMNPVKNSLEYKLLRNMVFNEVITPQVVGKNKIEGELVYNIEVNGNHNFFANFILVHNCLIDEMDKINSEDTSALHQALEQQIITISKANIQATLKAQTTLLAAANPKLGRFDPYLPIASQINMPATLINRFDLIFPIRDIPSREFDTRVATHVLMLQQKPEDIKAEFSPEFLKKYISYARQKIKPELTKEAVEEIKNFYVNLRNLPSMSEQELKPIPISARQLEALVRLAEGSARVRLSKKVTKKDAQRAIETLKRCLMQVGFDPETGQIDIDRISTGIPTSQRSKIIKIQALINELTKKVGKRIPVDDIILEASEQGISEEQVNEALELLKRDGTIYQPQPNIIEKI